MTAKPVQQLRIHGREETQVRVIPESVDGPSEDENPYWLGEDGDAALPTPEQGCIQRGLCCKSSPGWYAPGEVEKAAELLGIAPDVLVRSKLVVDRIEVDGQIVHVFAPVKLDRFGKPAFAPGKVVDELYRMLKGTCVFFDGKGCGIYAARPLECARYLCSQPAERNLSHHELAQMWLQGQ
jgi:Fe-S-cluster containining protein